MKKIVSAILLTACVLLLAGCSEPQAEEPSPPSSISSSSKAPHIIIDNQLYFAPDMPVNELPEGYEYIGVLSEDAANNTSLAGCKMYAKKGTETLLDFYLYQECGTPISKDTVDTSKRQWAYVRWSLNGN